MNKQQKFNQQNSKPILEELEERRLFSGGIEGLIVTGLDSDEHALYADADANKAQTADTNNDTSASAAEQQSQEIVFVDAGVDNHQQLVDDLLANSDSSRNIEVVVLDSDQDGIKQISAVLQDRDDLDAVHIISHGSDGNIELGNTNLNSETLQDNNLSIALWANAFAETGDILIYGCNLAETAVGKSLVAELSELTLADVAASDDLTGHESFGGDWKLEFDVGNVESGIALSTEAQAQWSAVLAAPADDDFAYPTGNLGGNGGGSGWAGAWGGTRTQVVPTSLTHPTGGLETSGGAVQLNAPIFHIPSLEGRDLASPLGGVDETVWASFLLQPDETSDPDFGYMGLVFGTGGIGNTDQLFVGYSGTDFKMNNWGGSGVNVSTPGAVSGETAFVVMKLELSASGADTATLYVNPTSGVVTPDTLPSAVKSDLDLGVFSTVSIGGGRDGTNDALLDQIRIGNSFAEVAPATTNAPTAADNTVTTDEDVEYVFTAADFNFADADAGDMLRQVEITTLPSNGTLSLSGVDVVANQSISVEDIDAGNLVFTPQSDQNGAGYDTFEFKVSDGVSAGTSGSVLHSFAAPAVNSMSGVAHDGTNIWLAGQNADTIYQLDTDGTVLNSFAAPGTSPTGIAFDGTNLWIISRDNDMVYEVDTSGNVLSSFATPGTDSRGLTWDGNNLWLIEGTGQLIYELTTTGAVVSSFGWPDDYMRDITWDGNCLWVSDQNNSLVRAIDTSGNELESFASPSTGAAGLAFDGTNFWHADADTDQIYQITNSNSPGYSASAYTMTIDVNAVNDDAVITGDISFAGLEGDAVAGDLNATDAEGLSDGTYFSVTTPAANGTAAIDAASGAWTFTPTDPQWFGSDSFTVTVTDDVGGTTDQIVNVTLASVNSGVTAINDSYTVDEDSTLNSDSGWFDNDWLYRRTLSFDNSARVENLVDFPVLVKLDSSVIDYAKTHDQGDDLRFFDQDGSALAHEIELWDEGGTSYVWVKIPQIDASSDTDSIVMYYGNAGVAGNGQDPAGVWSDYRATYHLNENPAPAGTITDSASNFDATNASSTDTAGIIGNAQDFNGVDQHIDLGNDRDWINNASAATLSIWMNADTTSGSGDLIGLTRNDPADTGASRITLIRNGDDIMMIGRTMDDGSDSVSVSTSTNPLSAGTWHHVTGTIDYASDVDNIKIYVDGQLEGTFSHNFTLDAIPNTDSSHAVIGADEDGSSAYFDGQLDEARIADQLRSADWVSAQYAAMTGNLVTVGFEQTVHGVLANDLDEQGDALMVAEVNGLPAAVGTPTALPSGAVLTLNGDGSFIYNPNGAFESLGSSDSTIDSFTYLVDDGNGNTATGTVIITVTGVDDAAVITGDVSYGGSEGDAVAGDMDASDIEGLTDGTYFTVTTQGVAGNAAIDATTGAWTFTPTDPNWFGSDSFVVTVTDDLGGITTQLVSITLASVNDDPVITSDGGGASTAINVVEGTTVVTTVTANDVDLDIPTFTITGGADQGLFNLDLNSGLLTFDTPPNFEGPGDNSYEVQVTADDGNGGTDVQLITVTVTNLDPIANGAWFDETNGGSSYADFATMAGAHNAYLGSTEQTIDLESLTPGDILSNQFGISHGVTFSNTGINESQVYAEGGAWIENLTGYDGSYAADGSNIYLKMANDDAATPFTIEFDTPVAKVGALLGMGKEGTEHSVTVMLYDSGGNLIDQQTLDAELWDVSSADQNYETFFGVNYDTAVISKIEILNASNVNYANALIFDQLEWSHTPDVHDTYNASTAVATITGNVLANDIDPAGGSVSVSVHTQPANGSAVYNGDGTFTYTSDVGFTGTDTFTYTIIDGQGGSDTATVSMQVSNAAPTITSDGGGPTAAINVAENTTAVTTVIANDADGHTPIFNITGGADQGLFNLDSGTGVLTFALAPDFEGPGDNLYEVEVTASDGHGGTDVQTINVTVTDVNETPSIAGVDTGAVTEDFAVVANNISTGGLLTIADPDTGESTFQAATINGTYGDLTIDTAGNWTYTADNTQAAIQQLDVTEFITDTLTVTSFDGTTHNVVITINGSEDASVISGTTTGSVTEDGTLTSSGALSITDTDTSDNPVSFADVPVTGGDNGYGTFVMTAGTWTYTLDNNDPAVQALDVTETLTDTYTFVASDGSPQLVTITINGAEDTPVFDSTAVTAATEDIAYSYTITTSDVDIETVTITAPTLPAWLTFVDNGDGTASLSGTPTNAEVGNHNVVLNVSDGTLSSNQNFTIIVANTNDPAVIAGVDTGSVQEDVAVVANNISTGGLLTIADPDTGESTFQAATINGTYGDLTIDTAGNWTYTADNTQAAIQQLDVTEFITDTLTVTSFDGTTHNVVITINGSEDASVISGTTTGSVTEDGTLTSSGALSITDTDTSDNPVSFADVPVTGGDNGYGTFVMTAGTWTYTLDNNDPAVQALDVTETLTDTYTFVASDGSPQLVTITINGAEDTPVFDSTAVTAATEDIAYSYTITTSDVDIETVTITAPTLPAWLTFVDNGDGTASLSGTPTNAEVGNHNVVLNVSDGTLSSNQNFTIIVANTNDPAVIAGVDTGSVQEDVAVVANNISTGGLLTIADPDTGESTFQAATINGTYGDLTIDTAGNWTYTADNTQAAIQQLDVTEFITDTLTVTSFDGTTHNVVITINGSEDASVISGTTTGSVTEDGTLTSSGLLVITDTDTSDPTSFVDVTPQAGDNAHGTFEITANTWTYILDNNDPAVQALDAGETLTDTYTFTAPDGVTQLVTVTINGSEDAAVIGGTTTGSVTEDGTLTSTGALSITDTDTSDNPVSFADVPVTGGDNGYGTFVMTAGTWTYTLDNSNPAVQALDVTETLTDTYTFTATDGSTQLVTITINGAEDAPVFDSTAVTAATEDIAYSYTITTSDVDVESLTITAPTLPAWLTFVDNGDGTATLSGTPTNAEVGNHNVVLNVSDGTLNSNQNFTIIVANTNDPAVIAGVDTGSVQEDVAVVANNISTGGLLTIADPDTGESTFQAATINGTYGDLTIDTAGNWTYTADNTQAAIQQLDVTEFITDTLTVTSFDGTTHNVVITINGSEDAAVIGGVAVGTVTEDGALIASDTLSITDVDTNDNPISFNDVAPTLGINGYGAFEITANAWTYTLNNGHAAVQALGAGGALNDIFTFAATDGSTRVVTVTINGANDAPVISGTSTGAVAEDVAVTAGNILDSGSLAIADQDTGESGFLATTINGTYGDLTIDAAGNWSYSADNSQSAIQSLQAGESVSDTLMVTTVDGSTHDVVITIIGARDAAPPPVDEPPDNEPPPEDEPPADEPPDEGQEAQVGSGEDPVLEEIVRVPQDIRTPAMEEVSSFAQPDEAESEPVDYGPAIDKQTAMIPEQPQPQAVNSQSLNIDALTLQVSDDEALNEQYELELLNRIDSMHRGMDSETSQQNADDVNVQIIVGSTASLTVGIVSWVLRGGALLASFMSTVPLLNRFDPLPILKAREDEEDVEPGDDDDEKTQVREHARKVDNMFSGKGDSQQ